MHIKAKSILPFPCVTQNRMFSVYVKDVIRSGPALNCLYPKPSTPMELITPPSEERNEANTEAGLSKILSSHICHYYTFFSLLYWDHVLSYCSEELNANLSWSS